MSVFKLGDALTKIRRRLVRTTPSSLPSVVLIAELRIPQCTRYRVDQKREHFSSLGIPCTVVDWLSTEACLAAVASASMVILYRVPADPPVLRLIDALRRHGVFVVWEVDDLIFDDELYRRNSNMDTLDPEVRAGNLNSVKLLRNAMLACDAGIASTPRLAQAMRDAGLVDVTVIENAVDRQTAALASGLRLHREAARRHASREVLITYGSGNPTHDADFRQATSALLRLLAAYPETKLRVIGDLRMSPGFDVFGTRVERVAAMPFDAYFTLLAESDISIAPLEQTEFNDAKSNIKFLEASILDIPSVCSPSAHFRGAIRHGRNGFVASDDDAWFSALSSLAIDADLRRRMGESALKTMTRRYNAARIARTQLSPMIKRLASVPHS